MARGRSGREDGQTWPAWAWATPALLLCLPVAIAWWHGFDGLYGQDAYAYFGYAVGPLREAMLALEGLPPFYWPPGYPLMVSLVSLVVGPRPLAGQAVSWLAALSVPLLTARLAHETTDGPAAERRTAALLAALLVGTSAQLWESSVVVMADTLGVAAATLGVLAGARHCRQPSPRWLVLATGAMAFAAVTRLIYALVAVPVGLAALWGTARLPRRVAIGALGAAALVGTAVAGPVALPAARDLLDRRPGGPTFGAAIAVYRWHAATAFRREHVTADGHLRYRLPNGLYYLLAPAHRFAFTPLLAPFLAVGLPAFWRRRRPGGWLCVAWPGVVYAFHAGTPWQNFRFTLAYTPPLAVLLATGLLAVRGQWPRARWLVWGWTAVAVAVMASGGITLVERVVRRQQAEVATVRWVEGRVEPSGHVIAFELTPALRYRSTLNVHELFEQTPAELARLVESDQPLYALLDVHDVVTQWAGLPPERNWRWLQTHARLIPVGRHGPYTLFSASRRLGASSGPMSSASTTSPASNVSRPSGSSRSALAPTIESSRPLP